MRQKTGIAALAALSLSGCAALLPPPEGKLFERGGVSMVVIPSGSRETYFSDVKSMERHCRAPSPDVSVTASEGMSLNLPSMTGKGVGVNEDASTGSLSLGGRSPLVLVSRELLYRVCELSNNLGLPPEQALALFRDAMETMVRLSAAPAGSGTAPLSSKPVDARVSAPVISATPPAGAGATVPGTTPGTFPGTFPSVVPGTLPSTTPGTLPSVIQGPSQ